jgi:hypothetical protein
MYFNWCSLYNWDWMNEIDMINSTTHHHHYNAQLWCDSFHWLLNVIFSTINLILLRLHFTYHYITGINFYNEVGYIICGTQSSQFMTTNIESAKQYGIKSKYLSSSFTVSNKIWHPFCLAFWIWASTNLRGLIYPELSISYMASSDSEKLRYGKCFLSSELDKYLDFMPYCFCWQQELLRHSETYYLIN